MQGSSAAAEALAWDDVRLFLSLCRSRTVGSAAKSLGVDSSTVSRRLVALEQALGATLFDRSREGITSTAAAEELLPIAEEIEQSMARFGLAAQTLERDPTGLVRLTCPPDVAEVLVAPLLRELLARHPGLQVELSPGEALLDLTRREADLALRTVKPTSGDLIVTRLTCAPWVLASSPEVVRELGTLRSWADARWVTWSSRFASLPAARWVTKYVRGREPIVRSDSLRVQLAIVASGLGVALVPEPSVQHYGLMPVKVARSLAHEAAEWPSDELYLVTHRALRKVPRVNAVWELIVERWGERGTAARGLAERARARGARLRP